jgi:hypothetical protein
MRWYHLLLALCLLSLPLSECRKVTAVVGNVADGIGADEPLDGGVEASAAAVPPRPRQASLLEGGAVVESKSRLRVAAESLVGGAPFAPISMGAQTHCGKHLSGPIKHNAKKQKICRKHDLCYMKCPPGKKAMCDKELVDAIVPMVCDKTEGHWPEGFADSCETDATDYYDTLNKLSILRYIHQQTKHNCFGPPNTWIPPG